MLTATMLEYPLLCRLCGSKTENGLYIYCDEGKRRQVETKIRLYLHFQVLPSDCLPKKICASCFEELEGMHRFAINALKVQDHLARLAKELPATTTDVCKSFMATYAQEPVMVNDTVMSLSNQEVTEMEVQVDPMVFLEDDQLDDAQDSEADPGDMKPVLEDTPSTPQCLTDESTNETNGITTIQNESDHNGHVSTELIHTHNGTITTNNQIVTNASSENQPGETSPSNQKTVEELHSPIPLSNHGNSSPMKFGQNGNVTESASKEGSFIVGASPSKPSGVKKVKKGTVVIKSNKKMESRSTLPDGIKCTTYTCPICKKVLMKKNIFKTHLETHRTDHKYACELCLRVFKKEINLIRHRKSHSERKVFSCTHCNRVYPTKSTLCSHLVSHSDERPHKCEICAKSFKRGQDLKFHLNQHKGLKPYRCPYCTKAFASSGNCFSHRRRAHLQEIERDRALKNSETSTN